MPNTAVAKDKVPDNTPEAFPSPRYDLRESTVPVGSYDETSRRRRKSSKTSSRSVETAIYGTEKTLANVFDSSPSALQYFGILALVLLALGIFFRPQPAKSSGGMFDNLKYVMLVSPA